MSITEMVARQSVFDVADRSEPAMKEREWRQEYILLRDRIVKYLIATEGLVTVRGSWLDAHYDTQSIWDEVRVRFNNSKRFVPVTDLLPGPIIPEPEILPLTGALDVKIKGTPEKLSDVVDQIQYRLGIPLSTNSHASIPIKWQKSQLYREAYEFFQPQLRRELKLTHVDELPSIPIIWFRRFDEILGIPPIIDYSNPHEVERFGLFQMMTHDLEALSVTLDADALLDWRTGLCFNLDLLSAPLVLDRPIDPNNPNLIAELDEAIYRPVMPRLPDFTELPDEAVAYFADELEKGNTVAAERFVNAVIRSLRKSQLHHRPYTEKTLTDVDRLMAKAAPLWFATHHNRVLTHMMNRDLEVAAELDLFGTFEAVKRLGIYRVLPSEVTNLLGTDAGFAIVRQTLTQKWRDYSGFDAADYTVRSTLLKEAIAELVYPRNWWSRYDTVLNLGGSKADESGK